MAEKIKSTDIYTVMLILALVAIGVACILLYLEVARYGEFPWWRVK